ncbi:MAG TPA: 4-alpha-glucanotransferase [Jiangellaceae bacterium]|nr:4-alpha-glucanotransferase [Jiangellaceae bacterium]
MTDASPELQQLAEMCGVATDYWDWRGNHIVVSPETIVAVLVALGVDATTPAAVDSSLAAARRYRWTRMLPPCVVTRRGWQLPFWVHITQGRPVEVWIELETGGTRHDLAQAENWEPPQELDDRLVREATFVVPEDLPLGYHTLHARSDNLAAVATLIVGPAWLGCPERMGASRAWGLSTQLYGVRSQRSWGIGDLGDLTDLAVWSGAELGAGFVLVNPLHAAEPVAPIEPSPYLPTTRRFANPLYLRLEHIPEFAYLDAAVRTKVEGLREVLIRQLDGIDTIDRDAAWTAKRAALELLYAAPRSAGREAAFRGYLRREGAGLDDFATWCALVEQHGADWRTWPEGLRHPRSDAVADFRAAHADSVDFHRWLQWVLDEQLDMAQNAARRAGMVLGIVHDLAVGVHRNGADSWILQDVLAQGISVGAPPDPFNQVGQDWQQPPWRPDRLADLAYAPFRNVVSTILRHAGGLRVDHVIGLFRLWWIPEGQPPTGGTYVRCDHEALIGILALEAYRAGALVVGEDLGTVEPWVRDYLRQRGILGTSVLWFEFDYDGNGAPLRPEWWREYCLASVTTHDLPPTAGYLAGDHIRLRNSLGLLTRSLEDELAADQAERGAWLDELRERGALRPDADVEETVRALHRFLTWTPARLLCVSLSDAVGDRRTQNQPGTIDEYPNWRVPLTNSDSKPMLLEDVMQSKRASALAAVVREGLHVAD